MVETSDRVERLRGEMRRAEVDVYLVPSSDAHQSEYVPDAWQRRAWISGFTGSMGDAAVGHDGAWQWADSRYWLQGEAELDPATWTLMRGGQPDVPELADWIGKLPEGSVVGYDPRLHGVGQISKLKKVLEPRGGSLKPLADNLIDKVWADQPGLPASPVVVWPQQFAGRSVAEKLGDLNAQLEEQGCDWLVMTTLDAIAWTFNVRGADVDFNPLVISYALIGPAGTTLFVDPEKIGSEVRQHLGEAGVDVASYERFGGQLASLSGRVWVDTRYASRWVVDQLDAAEGVSVHRAMSPVQRLRAIKNTTELAGMRAAHLRDAVAVCRFLHWLESAWQSGDLDEIGASDQLERFRAEGEHFRGLSFDTISGFGGNGAIVHYRATPKTSKVIDDSALYLVDSGGQYLDGTTDITRTVHLGQPSAAEREHYTRVLRGHLALRHTRFPRKVSGSQLDAIARQPLWEVGLNFGHGTGHGVGCYLSVHQGPHGIASRYTEVPLEPGMIVSNEPGYYEAGRYGIRVENLCEIVALSDDEGDYGPFYGFADLTLVPYSRKLIDVALLSAQERQWVDDYHQQVREALVELVPAELRSWLQAATAPL